MSFSTTSSPMGVSASVTSTESRATGASASSAAGAPPLRSSSSGTAPPSRGSRSPSPYHLRIFGPAAQGVTWQSGRAKRRQKGLVKAAARSACLLYRCEMKIDGIWELMACGCLMVL